MGCITGKLGVTTVLIDKSCAIRYSFAHLFETCFLDFSVPKGREKFQKFLFLRAKRNVAILIIYDLGLSNTPEIKKMSNSTHM